MRNRIIVCWAVTILICWRAPCSSESPVDKKPSLPAIRHQEETHVVTPYENIQLLSYLHEAELIRVMAFVVESLGIECTYCHNPKDYSLNGTPYKKRAREMIQMVHTLNGDLLERIVTCYTCHAGQTRPPYLTEAFDSVPPLLGDDKPERMPPSYENVRKLTHLTPEEKDKVMSFFVASTGAVACSACHNPADFASDELQSKIRSREMIAIVEQINPKFFEYERVTCHTCHQGKMAPDQVPENWTPGWS